MSPTLTIITIIVSLLALTKYNPLLCSTILQENLDKTPDSLKPNDWSRYYGDVEATDSNLKSHNSKRNNFHQTDNTSYSYRTAGYRKPLKENHLQTAAFVDSSVTNQQHDNQHQQSNKRLANGSTSVIERHLHKCRIWVPNEALSKYPWISIIQSDKSKQSQLIEICCSGFAPVRWRGNTICRPQCNRCANGLCIEPGRCQCYEEFVRNESGDCVFRCPLGCLNGRCYLDGSCHCNPGYKLDATRKFCRPICSSGCGTNPLHNCTEPEVCGCNTGYILTDNDCQPTCQPECGIGGVCNAPNVCECYAGYILKNGVCQADCYQKCDNGFCYSRNRCICNPGYMYHERSTQCIPA